jgi:mannitol-specific phosphotransferase system IIBC component
MIQPVSAYSPQAGFRGSAGAYLKQTKGLSSNSKIALLNAGGVSAAVGGLTMAVSRAHTTNWAHAMVLGVFGAFLSMFFMTPQIIEKASMNNTLRGEPTFSGKESQTKLSTAIKEYLKR